MQFLLTLIMGSCLFHSAAGQELIEWSEAERLTVNDFKGPAPETATGQSLVLALGVEVNLKAEDVKGLSNFNSRVLNLFRADLSWIDWREESRLRYARTLFDLNEWMTREMRKRFNENRTVVLAGKQESVQEVVRREFDRIRQDYDNESGYGNDATGQLRWEMRIKERIAALDEYCKNCKP